jgi:hypothetical protein
LYTVLMAVAFALTTPSLLVAKVLPVLLSSLAVVAAVLFGRELAGGDGRAGLLGGFLLAVDFFTTKFVGAGLETPLAVAAVLLTLHAAARWLDGVWARGRAVWLGCLLATAPLVRPELALLSGIVVVGLALAVVPTPPMERRTAWARLGATALAAAMVDALWLLFALRTFGSFVPNTVLAKTGRADPLSALAGMGEVLVAGYAITWGVALAASLMRWRERSAGTTPGARFLLRAGWVWVLLGSLGFVVSGSHLSARYWVVWLVVPVAMAGWGARRVAARLPGGAAVALPGFLALVVAQQVAVRAVVDFPWVERYEDVLYRSEVAAGRWLAEHSPPDAKVAALDVGAVGWYSQRRIVDLVGLVTPSSISATSPREVASLLPRSRADYAVLFDYTLPRYLPDLSPHRVVFRHRHRGYRLASPEEFEVVLVELHWPPEKDEGRSAVEPENPSIRRR